MVRFWYLFHCFMVKIHVGVWNWRWWGDLMFLRRTRWLLFFQMVNYLIRGRGAHGNWNRNFRFSGKLSRIRDGIWVLIGIHWRDHGWTPLHLISFRNFYHTHAFSVMNVFEMIQIMSVIWILNYIKWQILLLNFGWDYFLNMVLLNLCFNYRHRLQ